MGRGGTVAGVIDKELLEILACPQTHQPLRMATPAELDAVNAKIDAGAARSRGGKRVEGRLSEALVRNDAKLLYPVRDGIPMLLIDEGIEL
jgi:uncharacterized protein YbaR (Trm112 family)